MRKIISLLLLIASAGFAFAHSGATGIVKERMDGMGTLAQSMKALVQMERSQNIELDKAAEIARKVQAQSGYAMTRLFPAGQHQKVSEASPAIWQDWDRFEQISKELFQAAAQLEANAKSGSVDLTSAIRELGVTCSSCHQDFRIKKRK
ncbi:MAG: cytochrome c [Hyphomicrobiales bacterium]